MEREEELAEYKHVFDSFKDKEASFEKILKEKNHREDELLTKMSTLAEHFHKEKDKSSKLILEI